MICVAAIWWCTSQNDHKWMSIWNKKWLFHPFKFYGWCTAYDAAFVDITRGIPVCSWGQWSKKRNCDTGWMYRELRGPLGETRNPEVHHRSSRNMTLIDVICATCAYIVFHRPSPPALHLNTQDNSVSSLFSCSPFAFNQISAQRHIRVIHISPISLSCFPWLGRH